MIMTPGGFCYLDSYQDAPTTQPEAIGGYLTLEKVYSYDPIPEVLTKEGADYIQGVQANVWAEYITTAEHMGVYGFILVCWLWQKWPGHNRIRKTGNISIVAH